MTSAAVDASESGALPPPPFPRARPVGRRTALDLVQRFLAPFMSIEEIDQRCPAPTANGVLGMQAREEELAYEPIGFLNGLLRSEPAFFEDSQARIVEGEAALFGRLDRGDDSEVRVYSVKQRHRIRSEKLPARCALHLFLSAPRRIPGVQEVVVRRCHPPELARYYIPEAGLLHDVPLLVGYSAAIPDLEIEVEVTQALRGLSDLRDDELSHARVPAGRRTTPDIGEWVATMCAAVSPVTPRALIDGLLDRMEQSFRFAITGPPRDATIDLLARRKVGDVHTLSLFAAAILRELGFAVRLGAAQELFGTRTEPTVLRYVGSAGYDHRFLYWRHPETGTSGAIDLSYFRRWHLGATIHNTRTEAFRGRLRAVGLQGRARLRRGIYPLDTIIAGWAPPARIVDVETSVGVEALPPVDTEIVSRRAPGQGS